MKWLPQSRVGRLRVALLLAVLTVPTLSLGWLTWTPGRSYSGPQPAPTEHVRALAAKLESDVVHLASTIGVRDVYMAAAMERSVAFIRERFAGLGIESRDLVFQAGRHQVANVEAIVRGRSPELAELVVGAHYDSAGNPGANDNASGVAVLLALADELQQDPPRRTIRFVALANEEPPFFQTEAMGAFASRGT